MVKAGLNDLHKLYTINILPVCHALIALFSITYFGQKVRHKWDKKAVFSQKWGDFC